LAWTSWVFFTYINGTIDESPNFIEDISIMRTFNDTNPMPADNLSGDCEVLQALESLQGKENPGCPSQSIMVSPFFLLIGGILGVCCLIPCISKKTLRV
jgi:hypothetical protein